MFVILVQAKAGSVFQFLQENTISFMVLEVKDSLANVFDQFDCLWDQER